MLTTTSHRGIHHGRTAADTRVVRPIIGIALVLLAVATMVLANAVGTAVATIQQKPDHLMILGCHIDRDPVTGVITRSGCDH